MDLLGSLVRLRAPRAVDAGALLAIRTDPDVARLGTPASLLPTSPEQAREALTRRSPEYVRWVVERREDGSLLGIILLHRLDLRNRNAWLLIELGPPGRWGHGYGSETIRLASQFGFRQLGLEKLYLGSYEGNVRAMRAYRRAGYEVEAELARHRVLDGRLVTEYWLAAYRDDPLYAQRESLST
jgi:RimJ/RimL family protein N-acetyltransferase